MAAQAPAMKSLRRMRRQVRALPTALAVAALVAAGRSASSLLGFAGLSAPSTVGSRTLAGPVAADTAGRRAKQVSLKASMRDSEGNKIRNPKTFNAGDASTVTGSHAAEFKKRPFGVLAYIPSTDGKGCMVDKMVEKSRYPGDPQGQAFVTGVRTGMAIKSIGGVDVTQWEFNDILDLLDDKIMDNSAGNFQHETSGAMGNQPAELPLTIDYVTVSATGAGGAPIVEEEEEVDESMYIDKSDPRYADLPPDATLMEYKIPKAPASYNPPVVAEIRATVAAMPEPAGYYPLRYRGASSLDDNFIKQMITNFKNGQLMCMKDAYMMALDMFDLLVKEKTLGRVSVPEGKKVTVVGDLHGQLYDFDHMLSLAGYPSADNSFVFNGDFVDRGPWSVEVMFSLIAFKLKNPNNVFLNRGNHEAEMANHFYGFFGEVEAKYEKKMTELFAEIFRATPLCHVINDEVFVVHGGIPGPDPRVWWKGMDNQISFDGRQIQISLKEIEESDRFMEPNPADNPLMVDLLWSDPKGKPGYGPSGRMSSGIYLFGPDVSTNFMDYNGLKMVLRSHEVKAEGYRYDHEGPKPLITVFSAPNYVDKAGNKACVAVMTQQGGTLSKPEFIQYTAQPHPDVPSGAYAAGGPLHPDTVKQGAMSR